MVQLSHLYMTTGKTIALTRWMFVGKVMSLNFNKLSRFVIAFLPRNKHLLLFHFHQEALQFLFAFCHKGGVICISEVIDISPSLIPACASSSPAFLMMHSAYKLNKQGDNIQPWRTPFPVWNQSVVPCPVLTVASWPAYRFLRRQVRWSGIPISLIIFYSFFCDPHKGFRLV